jgi:hypothetical protein
MKKELTNLFIDAKSIVICLFFYNKNIVPSNAVLSWGVKMSNAMKR